MKNSFYIDLQGFMLIPTKFPLSPYNLNLSCILFLTKSVRPYTCPSFILGRRKPLLDDEQIESHVESYT